ncbi:MAG: transposase [Bacteroidota bacterium]
MIYAGLANLFQSQDNLSLNKFLITVIESLMLLEREEYLKRQEGRQETSNGSDMRDFRSLRTNNLQTSIPRSPNEKFKPMLLELVNTQKDQLNQLCVLFYQKIIYT